MPALDPVTVRPNARWKLRTARSVRGPKSSGANALGPRADATANCRCQLAAYARFASRAKVTIPTTPVAQVILITLPPFEIAPASPAGQPQRTPSRR
jgi:hypothetical protein